MTQYVDRDSPLNHLVSAGSASMSYSHANSENKRACSDKTNMLCGMQFMRFETLKVCFGHLRCTYIEA